MASLNQTRTVVSSLSEETALDLGENIRVGVNFPS